MRLLGKIFLLLLRIVAACIGYAFWQGPQLDTQSHAYVDAVVPAIVSTWSEPAFDEHASPELLQAAKGTDMPAMFLQFSQRLGGLAHYDGAQGESNLGFTPRGLVITANYTVKASFQKAPAMIHIRLIKHGEQWQVLNFFVDSPAFK
jgi:hypothetical protein